ncbi:MAG TPA: type IV pilus assembly protein PilM [Candidatus Methylomirabilis sp.]|nr:type IV pilus assembly protein PilM [Candidatus Methylomirabilis sp.]
MFLLGKMRSPLGLDISDLSIKLIQLAKDGDKIKIQALGKVDLPRGLLENGVIKDKKELARAIHHLVIRPDFGRVTTDEAVICLPENKTFLKIVELEKNDYDRKRTVENELAKHVPLPADQLYYDWQIIGDTGRADLIFIGAAERHLVDEQVDLLKEAHLSALAMESEPISVCRCLMAEENPRNKSTDKKNYAIIDIGATDASVTIYSLNTILFSVSIPLSGQEITDKIAAALSIDEDQAEKVKILHGLDEKNNQPAVRKIICEAVNDLTVRSREAIAYFNHHFPSWGPIEKILLCGGGANVKDLDKIIQQDTGIETAKGDVFVNLKENKGNLAKKFRKTFGLNTDVLEDGEETMKKNKESKTLKISHDTSLSFATAIGLALRGIFIDE